MNIIYIHDRRTTFTMYDVPMKTTSKYHQFLFKSPQQLQKLNFMFVDDDQNRNKEYKLKMIVAENNKRV